MAGPRYNNLNVRDQLDLLTTGHVKGAASVSGTAGNITTLTTTTLSATTLGAGGTTTLTGDLVRRNTKYMSGATASVIATGYTRCSANTTLPDEGYVFLSGISGVCYPKLPSPTIGRTITLIYTNSGAAKVSYVSGNFRVAKPGGTAKVPYLKFTYPGDSITLTNDGTYYYTTSPVSGEAVAGPYTATALP